MKVIDNPFVISGYEGPRYFCDRADELARLRGELTNGNNVALIATRRMGKSGLIEHLFHQPEIQSRYYTFFIDIYDAQSLRELVRKLSREILLRLQPHGARVIQRFWDTMRSIQPGITFSPMGEPSFNVQIGDIKSGETTLDEIFRYLELADKPCLVAIDEFQQIDKFPEKNCEATLRTYVQRCHNAQFIFSGSQRHTMGAMFTSASRPFYQSVSLMHLDAIDIAAYDAFAKSLFAEGKRRLADGVTKQVYAYSQGITWYTQKLFNVLYLMTPIGETCEIADVSDALQYVLKTQAYAYEETLARMPEKQKMTFIALAKNGPTKSITSSAFVDKYSLQSASTVQSAMRGLLEKDFVTKEKDTYIIYDVFMSIWLRQVY